MKPIAMMLFLALPITGIADDAPKLNTLTEKEIADGWILLFDGKTTFGWASPADPKWTVVDGMLVSPVKNPGILFTTTAFSDYQLSLEVQTTREGQFGLLTCDDQGKQLKDGRLSALNKARPGLWRLDVSVKGGWVARAVVTPLDPVVVATDTQHAVTNDERKGHIALSGNDFRVRNVKLRPDGMSVLFNGKNLDGWKEHPGQKSKFSVTKAGLLHVQDGKGDLQTEGQWADFVLQLECKSNGKHLNSGIFFRCLSAQYQMGYEAQIHNGFGDGKEYTLDMFDPKTNKPLEKKKEKYSALDFGTGAIYRRQPARFQASKDNEWFTMTVVARGRHFATWVNGIQQVDWTDNRPLGDNARVGSYLKKGPISIQGHDPTTDLHFRNIRIAELPSK